MVSYLSGYFSSMCGIIPKRFQYVYGWGDKECEKQKRGEIKDVECKTMYGMLFNVMCLEMIQQSGLLKCKSQRKFQRIT